jgi:ribosome-binding ATPase YchF (GTP1/OBG family)
LAHTVRDQFSADDLKTLKSYNFLTLKPFIYALNVSQDDLVNADAIKAEYSEKLQAPVAVVCVKIEEEMMDMSTEEKQEFLAEMLETQASKIPTLDDLISLAFNTL